MNARVEPPEEKKKKKKRKTKDSSPPPPSSSSASFSLLPDEIAENYLARISRSYYPTLSIVSTTFRSILSSTELYEARAHLESTEQCLYVCLSDRSYQFPQWFTLWINPNRTLPNKRRKKKKRQLLVPITSSNFNSQSVSVAVGSEIYVIGGPVDRAPSSAVRVLDCRSHTWRDAPSMIVARNYASACVYDEKIYVMGGCERLEDESWGEVFDTKTQTWELLPDPGTEVRKGYAHTRRISECKGKIQLENGMNVYAYDTKSEKGVWKEVKGLELLGVKHQRNGGATYNTTKLVSCGGKLLLIWEGFLRYCSNYKKKIWCAEIVLEKRGGGEVWGMAEWVDVVHTVPSSCSNKKHRVMCSSSSSACTYTWVHFG
ncbi:PREDICTED: F-box/kelch-repeat protein At4g19870-like isoform X3 [Camelina sativa]|uniref:F-box/kelch-repeat protein At4g19870-like isoform X3 n=1 Tax=Camelina sativa TaxID=90675 RepID=A0ABM1QRV7_CAMSA|nr:PREDICTED: F-box/kelch-repeat protein At4g19870-like isoform X3 [Camelina sativa]